LIGRVLNFPKLLLCSIFADLSNKAFRGGYHTIITGQYCEPDSGGRSDPAAGQCRKRIIRERG